MEDDSTSELRRQVRQFLREFKMLIYGQEFIIKEHEKYITTLAKYGLTQRDCLDCICGLEVEDYYDGPKKDTQHSGMYWEFGKHVYGAEIYIKLKIAITKNDDSFAIVYSFHEAEHKLRFPLKTKTNN